MGVLSFLHAPVVVMRPRSPGPVEQTVSTLRRLTLEAVVHGFQRAANAVITRSLADRD